MALEGLSEKMSHESANQSDGPRDCGTFFLDVAGLYKSGQITVEWSDNIRSTDDKIDTLIEQTWQTEMALARENDLVLYDGELCRLIDYTASDTGMHLTLGKVGYREFLGTNLRHAYLRYTHGPEVLANPLGVSASVISADGYIVMGRRSEKMVCHPERIHPIGGMVEPCASPAVVPDPPQSMLKELTEETHIKPEQVSSMSCTGLVRDKHIVQPELVFDIMVDADAADIQKGAAIAVDAHEHSEMITIRNHPATVVTFIEQKYSELTPVAIATLLLHGLHTWGSGWFATTRGYLRSVI